MSLHGQSELSASGLAAELMATNDLPQYLVYARDDAALDRLRAGLVDAGIQPLDQWRGALFGLLVALDADGLDAVSSNPDVLGFEENGVITTTATQTNPPWGLDRVDQTSLPLNAKYSTTATGAGVTAYVIDSGIRTTHTEFTGRVKPGFFIDFGDATGVNDCDGHGTHVAGTIGGTTYGVAKAVTIVPVKMLNCLGKGSYADMVKAATWIVNDHSAGVPAVANMSLGGPGNLSLDLAIQGMINDGITVVVAAGNESADSCMVSPARLPAAITVGASRIDDTAAAFSNHGRCNDLFAPGVNIVSAYPTSDTASINASGTSMAAPHVAGVAALILQGQSAYSPAEVAATLDSSSVKGALAVCCGDPNKLLHIGQLTAAVNLGFGGTGPGTVTSTPAGLSCTANCSASFASGTVVTLTATPLGDSSFVGWSGACSGILPTCKVTALSAQSAVATFNRPSRPLSVTLAGPGRGAVTSTPAAIACPATCAADFTIDSTVTLAALAAPGSAFSGWSGACTGGASACTVSMSAAQNVTANFAPGFSAVSPARILDSRSGGGTVDGKLAGIGRRTAGSITEVAVAARAGVPADATAIALNVAVAGTQGSGYITVWPCGTPQPNVSNLNYDGDSTLAGATLVKIGTGGTICIFTPVATDLIVDVNGFHPAGSVFVPLVPGRVLETRTGAQPTVDGLSSGIGLRAAGSVTSLPIGGRYSVPADAEAAVLNVTVTGPTGSGYVTVWPCGTPQPNASNVNYDTSMTIANSVVAKLGADGSVCLYTSAAVHLIVDLNGYYGRGSSFAPLLPSRMLESRVGAQPTIDGQHSAIGRRLTGSVTEVQIAGRAGIPTGAGAVVLNVTVTGTAAAGYLTIWPCASPKPDSSSLNFATAATIPNAVIAKLDAAGKVCIFTSATTDLIVDATGYYRTQ